MNQKAALCKALLAGEVVSIMTGFKMMGTTNIPREIGRSIERVFNVKVSRTQKTSKTRYGGSCYYFEYRLNRTEYNKEGIKKMYAYLKQHETNAEPKTEKERRELQKTKDIGKLF